MLHEQIMAAPLLTEVEKHKIAHLLNDLPDGHQLCHGDFHPDNLLIGKNIWIIDWMTGTAGDPACDVARTVILFSFGTLPENVPGFIKGMINMLRRRIKHQYVKWIVPVAVARLSESIPQDEKERLLQVVRERSG